MNDRKQLHELIHQLCNKLEQTNAHLQFEGDVSMLDIDLLRKTSIDIYDAINQLRLVKHQAPIIQHLDQSNQVEPSNSITQEPDITDQKQVEALPDLLVKTTLEELKDTPMKEFIAAESTLMMDEGRSLPKEEETEKASQPSSQEETKKEVDYEALNERLSEMPTFELPSDLASRFQGTPIIDLKKAISIAKKFEYINSLFNKDSSHYDQVIHNINHSNDLKEAWKLFATAKQVYNWDDEDRNYLELADLIRRRFL